MSTKTESFAELIAQDHARQESMSWSGRFLDYLELVRAEPAIAKLAHARLAEVVSAPGAVELAASDDPRLRRLFADERTRSFRFFSGQFFGIERPIAQIVRYLQSAALHGEESRQVLYLMGPVGAGKSSLVAQLERGLETAEPVYAIEGCPLAEEPLHLVPSHLRERFGEALGVHVEGHVFVAPLEFAFQPVAAHRAQFALDVHAQRLAKAFAPMGR